jgi:transposase
MRFTVNQFNERFSTDDVCLDYMFEQTYGKMPVCSKCGVVEPSYYRVRSRKCYECKDCGYQLHPLANTIFHKSSTSLRDWFYVIYLFSVAKNGVSAKEVERHLGVTYKTAWRIARQVRLLMMQTNNPLTGIAEVDETYIGGKHRRNSMFSNKTAVIGIVEKKKDNGQIKALATKQANATVALPFLHSSIAVGTIVHSDESRIYTRVKRTFDHEFVNHSKLEYVRAGVHTNTIEGFWGQLKRSIDGTYHCVSPKYLQSYVNEFVYRYNHRQSPVFPVLIAAAARRVR